MPAIRIRTQTMIFAIAAIAVLFAFFRPQANEDPILLSVVYGGFIVGVLVQSVIYAIGLLDFTALHPKESQSSTLEAGFEPKRRAEGRLRGQADSERNRIRGKSPR